MRIVRLLLGAGVFLMAGHVYSASIKEIVNDPRTYVDHTVTVEGDVTGVLSLFVFKYFTVSDGTGQINVVTERPLPRQGQKIKVIGKVKEVIALGRDTLLVLMEEKQEGEPKQQSKVQEQHLPGSI
jgi:hypothetical protein